MRRSGASRSSLLSVSSENDGALVGVASEAFAGEPYEVIVTTADVDASTVSPPPNVHVARSVPHTPVLERAACVVCHAGTGIIQKAFAHGVPVVAVPFARDQPEVARRVEGAGAGVRLPRGRSRPRRLRSAVRTAIGLTAVAGRIEAAFAAAGGAVAAFAAAGGAVAAADALKSLVPMGSPTEGAAMTGGRHRGGARTPPAMHRR